MAKTITNTGTQNKRRHVAVSSRKQINIPSVSRTSKSNTGPSASKPQTLLDRLVAVKKESAKKAAPLSPKERPALELSEAITNLFVSQVRANVLEKHFEERCKALKNELKDVLFPLYLQVLWDKKVQPSNPCLETTKLLPPNRNVPDCEGLFIVQDSFKIDNAQTELHVVQLLIAAGLPDEQAVSLVAENITITEKINIKFDELSYGRYEERQFIPSTPEQKAVANKTIRLLQGRKGAEPLTEEERNLLISYDPELQVKKGFLDRVTSYCANIDQLKLVLNIIRPQTQAKNSKFGISDSLTERNDRLIDGAKELLGITDADVRRQAETVLGLNTEDGRREYAKKVLGN